MAIKAGNLIHVGNGGVLIQRLQTGGPGQLNIPKTKIYELGNYKAVGIVYDTPDLTFTLDSTDVTNDIEAWMTRAYKGRNLKGAGAITATQNTLVVATKVYSAAGAGTATQHTLHVVGGEFDQDQVGDTIVVAGAAAGPADLTTTIASVQGPTDITLTAAIGVTVTVADVTVTVGNFVAADEGRGIVVAGAGTGGTDLVTTIVTVTNATHAVLADDAGTTTTTADVRVYAGYIDLADCVTVDVGGQFKAGVTDPTDPFAVIASAAIPFLYLSAMSYNYSLHSNNSMQATLNGDSIFYSAGSVYIEETPGSGSADQEVVTAHSAMLYDGDGNVRRVLAVEVDNSRLTLGVDYTESYGSITDDAAITTVTLVDAVLATSHVRIVYASLDEAEYPQSVHEADLTVMPAAVRGRDIEVYVGGYDPNDVAGSQVNKWTGVQSIKLDWKVTLDKDEEFGNAFAVGQDFDVPDVSGSIDIKPRNPADLFTKLRQTAGVSDVNKVLGPDVTVPLALDVVIKNPTTKLVSKRINVPDARFTLPGYSGKVQTKQVVTIPFDSDAGTLRVADL